LISCFIPSRNRACQAHACIDSIQKFVPNLFDEILLLYRADDDQYLAGYEKLLKIKQGEIHIVGIPEQNFRNDFLRICKETNYLCILTDDTFFYRDNLTSGSELKNLFDRYNGLLSFALRLGLNTKVQYFKTGELAPDITKTNCDLEEVDGKFLKWNFTGGHPYFNYFYPFACDGMVYRSEDIIKASQFDFKNLRGWEGYLCQHRTILSKFLMASFKESVCVNNPVNCVTDEKMEVGSNEISEKELNDRYLSGELIDVENLNIGNVLGCHQPFPLRFKNADQF